MKKLILTLFALFVITGIAKSQLNTWWVTTDQWGGTYASVRIPIDTAQTILSDWITPPWYDAQLVWYDVYVTSTNAGSSDSVQLYLEGEMVTGAPGGSTLTGEVDRIDTVATLSTAKYNVLTDTLNIQTGVAIRPHYKYRLRVFGRIISLGYVNLALVIRPRNQYKN